MALLRHVVSCVCMLCGAAVAGWPLWHGLSSKRPHQNCLERELVEKVGARAAVLRGGPALACCVVGPVVMILG